MTLKMDDSIAAHFRYNAVAFEIVYDGSEQISSLAADQSFVIEYILENFD